MKPSTFASKSFILAVAVFFTAAQIQSATYFVSINSFSISPSSRNINTGDTVVWINDDEDFSHTTTSTLPFLNPDYWNSTLVDYQDTFSKTFNNAGTFNYSDQFDGTTASIIVSAVTPPPVITLVNLRVEAGNFLFDATGLTIGKTNVLEVSTNRVQWIPVSTNITTASPMPFTNAITAGPHLFRVLEQP